MSFRGELALAAVVGGALVATAASFAPRLSGDSGEYVLMLESLYRHGSPDLRPADLESVRELYGARGQAFPEAATVGNYQEAGNGRRYDYHFWVYPALGVPARAALGALGGNPLRALPLTNALFFAIALGGVLLAWPGPRGESLLLASLLLTSPALAFLLWPHPEVLSFAFVTLALVARARRAHGLAVAAAALASVQNPPLLLLVALLLLEACHHAWKERRAPPAILATVFAALALLPAAFFLGHFGTWNLAVRPSEAAESLSFTRGLDLFFDLDLGMLPYAPVSLLLFLLLAAGALFRARFGGLVDAALLLALAFACTANSNWNNGTTGPSRYVTWMMPILLVSVVQGVRGTKAPSRAWSIALLVALCSQAAILAARGAFLSREDHLEHSWAARLVLDHAPRLYNPTFEIFWERTSHREGWPEGPVVYERDGQCRKALVRRRDLEELRARCGTLPARAEDARVPPGAGLDEKRSFLYVDF